MKICFVLLCYNSFADTARLARTLLDTGDENILVIAVDNASPERQHHDALEALAGDPRLELIVNDRNLGYAAGNNAGIEAALARGARVAVVLNPDVELASPPELLRRLRIHFEGGDVKCLAFSVAGLRPYLTEPSLATLVFPVFTRQVLDRIALRAVEVGSEAPQIVPTGRVHGCGFAIDPACFRALGLFDPGTFLYYEEAIVSLVMRRHGHKVYLARDITIAHRGQGATGGGVSLRHYRWMQDSMRYTLHRYFAVPEFWARVLAHAAVFQVLASQTLGRWLSR